MPEPIDFNLMLGKTPSDILRDHCVKNKLNLHEVDGWGNLKACREWGTKQLYKKGKLKELEADDWIIAGRYVLFCWILLRIACWNSILKAYSGASEAEASTVAQIMAETRLYYDELKAEEERWRERDTIPEQFQFYLADNPNVPALDFNGMDIERVIAEPPSHVPVTFEELMIGAVGSDIDPAELVKMIIHDEGPNELRLATLKFLIASKKKVVLFSEMGKSKDEQLNHFIGLLYLAQEGKVELEQEQPCRGPIRVIKRKGLNA